jgi:hypothetical protein
MDAVYGLTDITLVDELFYFIREQLALQRIFLLTKTPA